MSATASCRESVEDVDVEAEMRSKEERAHMRSADRIRYVVRSLASPLVSLSHPLTASLSEAGTPADDSESKLSVAYDDAGDDAEEEGDDYYAIGGYHRIKYGDIFMIPRHRHRRMLRRRFAATGNHHSSLSEEKKEDEEMKLDSWNSGSSDGSESDTSKRSDHSKLGLSGSITGGGGSIGGPLIVLAKLGWGHFSTVWLCLSVRNARQTIRAADKHRAAPSSKTQSDLSRCDGGGSGPTYVALKVQRSAVNYSEAARDEVALLRHIATSTAAVAHRIGPLTDSWFPVNLTSEEPTDQLASLRLAAASTGRGRLPLVRFLTAFTHEGPHGAHACMAFELAGENCLRLLRRYQAARRAAYKERNSSTSENLPPEKDVGCGVGARVCVPPNVTKHIVRQLLLGLALLHGPAGTMHTDVKLENVLLATPPVVDLNLRRLLPRLSPKVRRKVQRMRWPVRSHKSTPKHEMLPDDASVMTEQSAVEEVRDVFAARLANLTQRVHRYQRRVSREAALFANVPMDTLIDEFNSTNRYSKPLAQTSTPVNAISSLDMLDAYYGAAPISLADIGSACFIDQPGRPPHRNGNSRLQLEIQTVQYRAPEVILHAAPYTPAVDVWSVACLVFELLTGDFLFDPKPGVPNEDGSGNWSREEDHIASISELMGTFPAPLLRNGRRSLTYFHRVSGTDFPDPKRLRHINELNYWPLAAVLVDNYRFDPAVAQEVSDFLLPMLSIDPRKRVSAVEALCHPWLDVDTDLVSACGL